MSIRFIIGRSGTGKTTKCLTEMNEKLQNNPVGNPIIYLVPDQMTFLSEYKLATTSKTGGMIRAQVYSFTRLAWRILQETGGANRLHLNNVGINMLIRKIIEEQKSKFKVFKLVADKTGFTNEIEQILTEFRRYCVNPDELTAPKDKSPRKSNLKEKGLQEKLADLQLIYNEFEQELIDKYIDSEDYLQLLAEKISQSKTLKNAEIYIDGFFSFTPQEYAVVEQLMKTCRRVTIALTVDKLYENEQLDELNLFRMAGETSQTLLEIAKNEQIEIEEPVVMINQYRLSTESLQHLEQHFESRPVKKFAGVPSISICEAANRRAELEGIARKINNYVRVHDYRYRDLTILLRNNDDYESLIETVFTDYKIPYYLDQKQTMLNHPLIELIRSTLEIIANNWRYEPVFRAVKTELLYPQTLDEKQVREQMDRLENYVLAYGIQGDKWTNSDRWTYRRMRGLEFATTVQTDKEKEIEQQLNELREYITTPILQLTKRLKKATNGRQLCEALFLYLEDLDIKDKLEKWQLVAEQEGKLIKSSEHNQVWTRIIELLDQFVEILGEEKLSLKRFISIIDSGLESLTFNTVPPALDQVVIADLENSRLDDVKVCFVIGLNEGILPAKLSDDGLLADDERELLATEGITLAPTSKTRLLDETFVAYKAFTIPSEQLYLTYPIANEEGKSLIPSFYVKRMKDIFPNIQEEKFLNDPLDLPESGQLSFIVNEDVSLSFLITQLERFKRNYPVNDLWWEVYNYYVENKNWQLVTERLFSSLFYKNSTEKLQDDTTRSLYGEEILASVSRMEMFQRCPFSHYAQHGLKLRERQVFRLEAPHIGDLFHSALKYIADTILKKNLSWASLTKNDCKNLATEAVNEIAPKLQNEILFSSNRHFYMKRKLENVISRASFILSEQAKQSGFNPVGLEVGFGPNETLPPLTLPLKNNFNMELRGRIDRVDKAEDEAGVYLRVIDYKSSDHDLNLTEVYYGLSLQMLTYLDIVMTYSTVLIGDSALPAGMLYFHVHNPIINAKTMLPMTKIEQAILKEFRMKGLVLADGNVVKLMDKSLESGNSDIVSVGFRKDGSLTKRSKVASKSELELMMKYVRNVYVKAGNSITSGENAIAPYKLQNRTACTFCPFKAVCQFDESLEGNSYRYLAQKTNDDFFALINEEVYGDEQDGNSSKAE